MRGKPPGSVDDKEREARQLSMQTAEAARIQALRAYDVLDTPPEEVFTEMARLAATITHVPIALLSFVDHDRQWFKARVGLEAHETPRAISFCTHAIKGREIFEVTDATLDPRFAANPLVTGDPLVRFYAGAPLVTPDGRAIGTLCVIDSVPRALTAEQREALQILSRHAVAQLELRRRVASVIQQNVARSGYASEVREAIRNDEFLLHYQPKVDLHDGSLTGVEALIRWNHPQRGLVQPNEFISLLERSDLIGEVGEWVLRRAARDYLDWLQRGLPAPRIAVNISPAELRRKDFVGMVRAAISDIPPGMNGIDIEITESVLMHDIDDCVRKLTELRELGVVIAIDDFGTGYSSLRQLARLPIDTLKIDHAFVQSIVDNAAEVSVVSSIISLARSLGMQVVAEGVETEEQRRVLRLLRCDQVQGFLLSPPMTKEDLETRFLMRVAESPPAAHSERAVDNPGMKRETGS